MIEASAAILLALVMARIFAAHALDAYLIDRFQTRNLIQQTSLLWPHVRFAKP